MHTSIMCLFFLGVYHIFAVQVLCLEKSLEEMLTRVDEFVGMLDMVRSMSFPPFVKLLLK